jgi:hypothetical protein
MVKLAAACAAPVLAMTLIGCSQSGQPPARSSPVASTSSLQPPVTAETLSTAVPAGVDSACEHATPSGPQLTGDWTEPDSTIVTTLSADGTLKYSDSDRSGAWSYLPWASTPAKNSMPPGQEDLCVLWLHWQSTSPPMDFVYVPLKATATSVKLSYVGRGNTLTWVRPQPSA